MRLITLAFLSLLFFFSYCKKEPDMVSMQVHFTHNVDGKQLVKNKMEYVNEAGNPYEVTEIMYFISELKLFRSDGSAVKPGGDNDIHYIDTNDPSTFIWDLETEIPTGKYDSLTFIFGISEERNKTGLFVNPPEVNMAWPPQLGGGYHYMMLNGFWLNTAGERKSFNFHLGIGQIYTNSPGPEEDSIRFIQNYFSVKPPDSGFSAEKGQTVKARFTMNIENWFRDPHTYDHNQWGGAIMQNQNAMQMGCENGWNVFSVEYF
ncbi:MAG: MbnP family protein [Bacteroidales bacterium]